MVTFIVRWPIKSDEMGKMRLSGIIENDLVWWKADRMDRWRANKDWDESNRRS